MRGKLKWLGIFTVLAELIKLIIGSSKPKKNDKIEPTEKGDD